MAKQVIQIAKSGLLDPGTGTEWDCPHRNGTARTKLAQKEKIKRLFCIKKYREDHNSKGCYKPSKKWIH